MRVVYSQGLEAKYTANPVENPDRVRLTALELGKAGYTFEGAKPASMKDILKIHGGEHVERVMARDVSDVARLAAGGAIMAAELAMAGEPAFALIRPPGHHASANRSWGMCYFNNMAIAMDRVRNRAGKVLILDIDLHFGDGTVSIFRGAEDITIVNPGSIDINCEYLQIDGKGYLEQVRTALDEKDYGLIGVSAGFDTYIEDWGRLLTNDDFRQIGKSIKDASEKRCQGRRFAVLEGGYHPDLRYNVKSFLEGFG